MAAGQAVAPVDGGFAVRDPRGTALAVASTAATGSRTRAVVRLVVGWTDAGR